MKRRFWMWLAWRLPRPLIYWASIRVTATATNSPWSQDAALVALRRWAGDHVPNGSVCDACAHRNTRALCAQCAADPRVGGRLRTDLDRLVTTVDSVRAALPTYDDRVFLTRLAIELAAYDGDRVAVAQFLQTISQKVKLAAPSLGQGAR